MKAEYIELLEKSKKRAPVLKRHLNYLVKFNIKNFDHVVHDFHDEVFAEISCLECGNCCRCTQAYWGESDVKLASKLIGMTPKVFVRTYLSVDPEGGYLSNAAPCPFFSNETNECSVYERRPRHCQDYPFTMDRAIQKSLGRILRNTEFCPAAYLIAEKIIERYAKEDKD